jgi:hypothetical protein
MRLSPLATERFNLPWRRRACREGPCLSFQRFYDNFLTLVPMGSAA